MSGPLERANRDRAAEIVYALNKHDKLPPLMSFLYRLTIRKRTAISLMQKCHRTDDISRFSLFLIPIASDPKHIGHLENEPIHHSCCVVGFVPVCLGVN